MSRQLWLDDHKTVPYNGLVMITVGLVTVMSDAVMSDAWLALLCAFGGWTPQLLSGIAVSVCESENLCGCVHTVKLWYYSHTHLAVCNTAIPNETLPPN